MPNDYKLPYDGVPLRGNEHLPRCYPGTWDIPKWLPDPEIMTPRDRWDYKWVVKKYAYRENTRDRSLNWRIKRNVRKTMRVLDVMCPMDMFPLGSEERRRAVDFVIRELYMSIERA